MAPPAASVCEIEESSSNAPMCSTVITLPENTTTHTSPEIIIVGAGVAGASLAAYLAKNGKKVLVIERSMKQPDRIVGELLQPGGVQAIKDLGLEECFEGIDSPQVEGYGMFFKGESISLPYPDLDGVPQRGRSFHHGLFVQKLRQAMLSQPLVEVRTGTVTSLKEEEGRIIGVEYKEAGGKVKEAFAPLTVVCDGCFSCLRTNLCKAQYEIKSYFYGLVLRNVKLPMPNRGHVILADPSPVLFYPISSTEVRALVDFTEQVDDVKTQMLEVIAPQLPEGIKESFIEAVNEGRIRSMPNRIMSADPYIKSGAILLGDALNMRHPLTGGGMTVAFTDVKLLGDQILSFGPNDLTTETTEKLIQSFYSNRQLSASSINILANALYDVFCEKNSDLREACFAYLKMGGMFSRTPIALLSGLSRDDRYLLIHFFSVAFFGVGRLVLPSPTPNTFVRAYKMLRSAVHIIQPLAVKESANFVLKGSVTAMSYIFP